MPTSAHGHVTKMIDWIVRVQPKSILDIGVGFGKWGFLSREYTDIAQGRYHRKDWLTRIDGVEAFRDYETPVYDYVYDSIRYGDVLDLVADLPSYDLVIIGDVIEHFTKEDGLRLLAALLKNSAYVALSSPLNFFDQEYLANSYERHLSIWGINDFKQYSFEYEEFDQWLFAILLKGQGVGGAALRLDKRSAVLVHQIAMLRRYPKLSQLCRTMIDRWFRATQSKASLQQSSS